jgi:hypothetical protein
VRQTPEEQASAKHCPRCCQVARVEPRAAPLQGDGAASVSPSVEHTTVPRESMLSRNRVGMLPVLLFCSLKRFFPFRTRKKRSFRFQVSGFICTWENIKVKRKTGRPVGRSLSVCEQSLCFVSLVASCLFLSKHCACRCNVLDYHRNTNANCA